MSLVVGPLSRVEALIEAHRPSHIVTILAPTDEIPQWPQALPHRRLVLQFHDVDAAIAGFVPPDAGSIARLLRFAEDWSPPAPLLVHCWAGISRSTAAAFILACARGQPGYEMRTARRLRAAAPYATPNSLMVRLADDALQRGGAMSAAVASIGRGADFSISQGFVLPLDPPD